MWIELFGGVALGVALGWVLQRGGFCMNTAFRSIMFGEDRSTLKAWCLVLLINIPAVTLSTDIGFLRPQTTPFFWPALIVGGLLFGVGMVWAGGCASGTYYRAGRGMLGSWGALIGFLFGTAAMDGGALGDMQRVLRTPVIDVQGREATLFNLFGVDSVWGRWTVVALLMIPIAVYLIRAPKQKFVIGWSWRQTGLSVGLLALATWVLSALIGRDFGLSFTQPSAAFARLLVGGDGSGVGLPLYLLVGVPLGAYFSAAANGEAGWKLPEPKSFVRQTGGGLVMGLGASLAGGCNIGHGISGIASLGLGSITGVASIMVGCWIMTALVFRRERALSVQRAAV